MEKSSVEASDGPYKLGLHKHVRRACRDRVERREQPGQALWWGRPGNVYATGSLIEECRSTVGEGSGFLLSRFELSSKLSGRPQVIVVEEGNPASPGGRDPGVAGGRHARGG
jgi:hypothetical protein